MDDAYKKLLKDLTIGKEEAAFLVDLYYQVQGFRIATGNMMRAASESEEPISLISYFHDRIFEIERQIPKAMDRYTDQTEVGKWAKSIVGIGPILSAGLVAHIDPAKATTPSKIWRFAGLDPTCKWNKGEKRPWNAALKVLCWKIGESFVKVSGNPKSTYGKEYALRKAIEQQKNDRKEFAAQAREVLASKKWRKETASKAHYQDDRLPPAHIHARAKRRAVKLFLSHFWQVMYREHFGQEPPKPYVIENLQHRDYVSADDVS